nr:MAG TPA: hypothetical protein [Caudoviricetes sp.]DAW69953.1 MAG TPA: hypothetical protein [Caudoviricetes sp.]
MNTGIPPSVLLKEEPEWIDTMLQVMAEQAEAAKKR